MSDFQEVHHRVKNHLQIVASILRLQMRQETSLAAKEALAGAVHRMLGMAVAHDLLAKGSDGARVGLKRLLTRLLDLDVANLLLPGQVVTGQVEGDEVDLDGDRASALAIAANELILNALKHGFKARGRGRIAVRVERRDGTVGIEVGDDGEGLPEGFRLAGSSHLGLRLVRSIVESDLGGTFTIGGEGGAKARVEVPLDGGDPR